ncbi:MAG: tetratricopeptide repeat protein, partial [Polyangiaceae bacterium]|nr:tetratricopeptide repeat protein [Polyangiaceae bacterium]
EHPLLALLRTDDPPVELAALLIAHDARRSLDVEAELRALDELAAPLRGLGASARDAGEAARALAAHLHGVLGFHGNREDYYDPRNSYLDQAIARRTGIPITLSVIYLAVARRAGVPMDGVGFPGRFFVRVGGPNGVYQDPFDAGRVLDAARLEALGRSFLGDRPIDASHLAVADSRAIATRILVNLQLAHARRGDHPAALLVCDRLVELTGDPARRRDRGLHALAMRSFEGAVEDLESYLRERPTAEDRPRVEAALRMARANAGRSLN